MGKNPKRFCYYCNHIIDYKCQRFVKCSGCETVCHADCINIEDDQIIPKIKIKKSGKKGWKITNKNEVLSTITNYTCNKCCLKETPFSTIITNSKGAIKKQFTTVSSDEPKESRKIIECIEPDFLNSLFYSTENINDDGDSPHNLDEGFRPMPDRYFNGNTTQWENFRKNLRKHGESPSHFFAKNSFLRRKYVALRKIRIL